MKWFGLFAVLAAIVPLSLWLKANNSYAPKMWMLFGFLPFVLGFFHLYIAIISWPDWSGYVKGMEFSVLDGLALAIYLSLPPSRQALPFRFALGFYFFAVVLSAIQAPVPMAALFYPWQLARMFLVYAVVVRACADPRVPVALLKGMGLSLFFEAGVGLWQRFGLGMLQINGTVDHQNLLGLMSHFIALPAFAVLLERPSLWLAVIPVFGIAVAVLTTSRATLGLASLGYAVIFASSALRSWTARKATMLLVGTAVVIAIAPLALSSFDRRFAREVELFGSSNYDERAAFESAATTILWDHPLGCGANNYVLVANIGGYNLKAGVAQVSASRGANVHNFYLLIAAETGYLGLVSFLLILIQSLIVAFRCGWSSRQDVRGSLLIGLGVALLIVGLHSFFEWIFILFEPQYLFAINLGLIAGLAQQLGYWRKIRPRIQIGIGTALPLNRRRLPE